MDSTLISDVIREKLVQRADTEMDPEPIDLGPHLRWRPTARTNEGGLLHVVTEVEVRGYLRRRIAEAKEAGHFVALAIPDLLLWEDEFVRSVGQLDAEILVYDTAAERLSDPMALPTKLADLGVRVSPETRRELGLLEVERAGNAIGSSEKGRRLESTLSFILGQVKGLYVVERNLRTATEELDIVLQKGEIDKNRCWNQVQGPLMLVEAKNWSKKVGQAEISEFWTKLRGKRGMARLGLFASISGFSRDAELQILRFSSDKYVLVKVGQQELLKLCEAADLDLEFDAIVRAAMLE